MVTDTLREWFEAEPWRSSGELLQRLRAEHPDKFTAGQIRTLQRRVKAWRGEVAHKLVFGDGMTSVDHSGSNDRGRAGLSIPLSTPGLPTSPQPQAWHGPVYAVEPCAAGAPLRGFGA